MAALMAKSLIRDRRDAERRAALALACGGRFPAKRLGALARLVAWLRGGRAMLFTHSSENREAR